MNCNTEITWEQSLYLQFHSDGLDKDSADLTHQALRILVAEALGFPPAEVSFLEIGNFLQKSETITNNNNNKNVVIELASTR